jgi:hypothetical protein
MFTALFSNKLYTGAYKLSKESNILSCWKLKLLIYHLRLTNLSKTSLHPGEDLGRKTERENSIDWRGSGAEASWPYEPSSEQLVSDAERNQGHVQNGLRKHNGRDDQSQFDP